TRSTRDWSSDVCSSDLVRKDLDPRPTSVLSYTDPQWRNKAVIANPLFGTTTDHVAALFASWGDARARAFMADLRASGVKVSASKIGRASCREGVWVEAG